MSGLIHLSSRTNQSGQKTTDNELDIKIHKIQM